MNKKIVATIVRNRSMSVRDVAKICETSATMVQRTKKRNDGKTRVKQKIPKISSKQQSVFRTRARKLYDFLGTDEFHLVEDVREG